MGGGFRGKFRPAQVACVSPPPRRRRTYADTNVNDRPVGVGRNTGEGFNFAALDLRLGRRIRFTERMGLEVIAEGFNMFNRANFRLPNATFGTGATPNPSFGRPTAADPRQIQFGLRLSF